ncbi:hypothetical protein M5D10_14875 [Leptospira santarosai]|uniref:hypothetical protein n=1 Tax=Leptospira santarosai TaxID=28183 RepID=UPI0022A9541F|nr:hypothetical protein [Leptospira santarosai]UZN07055.1 hypothetical protein M5D10_14875 [Leptospira santarosai]
MGTAAFSFRILKQTLNQENLARYGSLEETQHLARYGSLEETQHLARYGSLIFATQRTNACATRLLVISLTMDRSSLLRKEPTLALRGFWLSRSLWIAHLCYAKNQRLRYAAFGYLAHYGSLIFATQRTNACATRLLVISLTMDRSSLLCKEPTLALRGFWLSRSLWIAHLCFAKNQRLRYAAFGYLAHYGSLIFALQRTNACATRLLVISLTMDRSIGRKT